MPCLDTQHRVGVQGLQYYDRVSASMGHEQIRAAIEYIAGVIDRQRFEILTDGWMLQNVRQALDSGATVHSMCIRRIPTETTTH
jgi:hypothetical protein